MAELIRDTAFGHLVRLVTRGKYLQYAEDKDPSMWQTYISGEKTKRMAHHGQLRQPSLDPLSSSEASSRTLIGDERRVNEFTGHPIDREKGRDMNVVAWFGEHDAENPMNWSIFKKVFVTFEICFLTWSVYIGSAIYSPGIDTVVKDFGVSRIKATLGLTLFVAGYGIGPMLPTALSTNFAMLLCFRFLTGFIGSPALAIGGASIGDMFAPNKRAYGMGIWGVIAISGPALGPIVGGFAAEAKGWRWTIWELMWGSGFCLVILFFFLPETSSANILYRRSRRLRELTGIENLKSEAEIHGEQMTAKDVALIAIVRPFTLNLEPMVFLLNLYTALVYGLLYIWFESFPIVFADGSSCFAIGNFLLFNSVFNYLGDAYPNYAASVLAGNDFMRSAFAAGFPLFATAMYKNEGIGWASSILGCLAIAFIPIPFGLYKYGERLRRVSKYAKKDF
ncbi:MAG: hypothetical protein Q9186_002764 [Xanthomendoza sp. 1 TL-2023]